MKEPLPIVVSGVDMNGRKVRQQKKALESDFAENDVLAYAAVCNILLWKGKIVEVLADDVLNLQLASERREVRSKISMNNESVYPDELKYLAAKTVDLIDKGCNECSGSGIYQW